MAPRPPLPPQAPDRATALAASRDRLQPPTDARPRVILIDANPPGVPHGDPTWTAHVVVAADGPDAATRGRLVIPAGVLDALLKSGEDAPQALTSDASGSAQHIGTFYAVWPLTGPQGIVVRLVTARAVRVRRPGESLTMEASAVVTRPPELDRPLGEVLASLPDGDAVAVFPDEWWALRRLLRDLRAQRGDDTAGDMPDPRRN